MSTFNFKGNITGSNNEIEGKTYALVINDRAGNRVLSWQTKPIQEIILNGKTISQDELIEKLKSLRVKTYGCDI